MQLIFIQSNIEPMTVSGTAVDRLNSFTDLPHNLAGKVLNVLGEVLPK